MADPGEVSPADTPERFVARLEVRSAVWLFAIVLATFGVFAVFNNAAETMVRMVIGVVLALALDGLVQSIRRRWNLSRSVAVGLVGVGLMTLAGVVLLVLGPPAVQQAREFSSEIPQTVEEFYDLPLVGGWLEENDAKAKVQEWIDQLPANVSDEAIADAAERLVGGVLSTVVVLVTTFALLLDGERIVNRGRRLVPFSYRDEADRVARVVQRSIGRYFGGSLTVASLMGLYVLTIGLIFNVPLAPLAAIWAMLTSLIPQVGGFLGGAFLFVLAVSNGVGTAVVVTILFVIYMNLENHVISPAIVGQAVNLSPPTTMLAALIGGAVAGLPGALITTPLVGAVKQLYLGFRFGDAAGQPGGPRPPRPPGRFKRWRQRLLGAKPGPEPSPTPSPKPSPKPAAPSP